MCNDFSLAPIFRRAQAIFYGMLLGLTPAAPVHAEPAQGQPVPAIRPQTFSLPEELGFVLERHAPSNPAETTVIFVQEVHSNYEAQKHLAELLKQLMDQQGLRLILVEGGEGDLSVAYLRRYGSLERRKQAAEEFLKAGLISGEEYLDLTSDGTALALWGIEDKAVYEQHIKAFLDIEASQQSLEAILASVHQATTLLAQKLLDPELIELQGKTRAYEEGQLDVVDYVEWLTRLAGRTKFVLEAYSEITTLRAISKLGEGIRMDEVAKERRSLIERLNGALDQPSRERLIERVRQLKEGAVTEEAFYTTLRELAATAGLGWDNSSPLARYLDYVVRQAALQPLALESELGAMAAALRKHLAASTLDGQMLEALMEQVDLVGKYAALQLTPAEYHRLQERMPRELAREWVSTLTTLAMKHGLTVASQPELGQLQEALPKLEAFYQLSLRRDHTLTDRAIKKLHEVRAPLAVLVAGGFHGPHITQSLRDRGFGVVTVMPAMAKAHDERLYRAVLKYTSGRASFEDVMTIADENGPMAAASP